MSCPSFPGSARGREGRVLHGLTTAAGRARAEGGSNLKCPLKVRGKHNRARGDGMVGNSAGLWSDGEQVQTAAKYNDIQAGSRLIIDCYILEYIKTAHPRSHV